MPFNGTHRLPSHFHQVMHSAGYSGTATYVKQCEVGTLAAVEGLKGCCGFRRTAEGIFVSQEGCRFSCKSFIEQWESAMLRESEAMPEALMDEVRLMALSRKTWHRSDCWSLIVASWVFIA